MMTNAYAQAAEALLLAPEADALASYNAVRRAHPELDWSGHDRRAARLAGRTYEDQGADPALAANLVRTPHLPKLPAEHIKPCSSCGARIYWSDTQGGSRTPCDVTDEGYATRVNHFTTCKSADQHRRATTRKGRAA